MNFIKPGAEPLAFLGNAMSSGYAMHESMIDPDFCADISEELKNADELRDLNEMNPIHILEEKKMDKALSLRGVLSALIRNVDRESIDVLGHYSVRVFPAGEHATTIHRNHEIVGPWALGVTLKGESEFAVYDQIVLPQNDVLPILGDGFDPEPKEKMVAAAGAVWALYTKYEQMPHSGGLVNSDDQRELLIFYDLNWKT